METTSGVPTYVAFARDALVASGELRAVLTRLKSRVDRSGVDGVLLFADGTGEQLEVSFDGTLEEVLERTLPSVPRQGRGRPKLGVVPREVTLLPRHWEWLERQPQGVSAALRRLVDEARKHKPDEIEKRTAREAAHRFMTAIAGNRAGYEDALRALYARDRATFERKIARWPKDVRGHAAKLAKASF